MNPQAHLMAVSLLYLDELLETAYHVNATIDRIRYFGIAICIRYIESSNRLQPQEAGINRWHPSHTRTVSN
jgi:hypothetical protein